MCFISSNPLEICPDYAPTIATGSLFTCRRGAPKSLALDCQVILVNRGAFHGEALVNPIQIIIKPIKPNHREEWGVIPYFRQITPIRQQFSDLKVEVREHHALSIPGKKAHAIRVSEFLWQNVKGDKFHLGISLLRRITGRYPKRRKNPSDNGK